MYKWSPIVFGCHCRSDRSFFWKNRQFPICARCTGEAVGMVVGIPFFFFLHPGTWALLVMMIPMIVDGFVQKLTRYESTNHRRFLTGFLFGVGLVGMFWTVTLFAFRSGLEYGRYLRITAKWRTCETK